MFYRIVQSVIFIDSRIGSPLKLSINYFKNLHLHLLYFSSILFKEKTINHSIYSQELKKNGFVIIRDLLDVDIINSIRESLDNAIDEGIGLNKIVNDEKRGDKKLISDYIESSDICKGQNFLRNKTKYISIKEPFLLNTKIFDIALNSEIVEIINSYLGYSASITGVNLRKSYVNNLPIKDTQCFHVDKNSVRFLKVFVYLNDVKTKGYGQFVYINKSHKNKFNGWLKKHRWDDVEIFNAYGKENCMFLTANIGDVIIADTRGFHKGEKPTIVDRYLLTLNYGLHREFTSKSKSFKINSACRVLLSEKNRDIAKFLIEA